LDAQWVLLWKESAGLVLSASPDAARQIDNSAMTTRDRIVQVYPKEDGAAKLRTKRGPAVARVRTEERAMKILNLSSELGMQVIIGVESHEQENISDVERILSTPIPAKAPPRTSRNDYRPCGSGKRYKKCAGQAAGA